MEIETPAINQHLQNSIDALLSKTTTQEPTDSRSSDRPKNGDKREAIVHCEKHGDQAQEEHFLLTTWTIAKCPACREEAEQERLAQVERQKKLDAEARERNRIEWAKRSLQQRLDGSDIPARFKEKTLEGYEPANEAAAKVYGACLSYVASFGENLPIGRSLILCGTAGTGKTHIACGITRAVIERHDVQAVYTTAGRMFRKVKDTYSKASKDSESDVIAALSKPELLVIDEVGTTFGSETERNIFFEVINERYERLRPTIIISNLSPENLMEFAGERVIDRMKENGGKLLKFDWSSFRGTK